MLWKKPGPLYETAAVSYYLVLVLHCSPALRVFLITACTLRMPMAEGVPLREQPACLRAQHFAKDVFLYLVLAGLLYKRPRRGFRLPLTNCGQSSNVSYNHWETCGGIFYRTSCSLCMTCCRRALESCLLWKQCLWKLGPNSSTEVANFL